MRTQDGVSEADLLAYADGLLEQEPGRKALVEAALRRSPEFAERVRAYQAQTRSLRLAYGHRALEPVPDALYAVLQTGSSRGLRMARIAAALALLLAGGLAGWLLARWEPPMRAGMDAFLTESYHAYMAGGAASPAAPGSPPSRLETAQPVGSWLPGPPDLSRLGYRVTDRQAVSAEGKEMVRFTYVAADGRSFALFLQPRWVGQEHAPQVTRQGQVSLAYWLSGPVAFAMASRLPPEETLLLAERVRQAATRTETQEAAVAPYPPLSRGPQLTAPSATGAPRLMPALQSPMGAEAITSN